MSRPSRTHVRSACSAPPALRCRRPRVALWRGKPSPTAWTRVPGSGMADTKDWTWVLEQKCPECGFDAGALAPAEIGAKTRNVADRFATLLAADDVGSRPDPDTW